MIVLYLLAFVFAGPAALAGAYGLWVLLRTRQRSVLGVWLASILLFYLVWFGNAATGQSYYNLPALAPLCALFGIGVSALLSSKQIREYRRIAATVFIIITTLSPIPIWKYLFKQDQQLFSAALWTKANTSPRDNILYRPNHHWSVIDYPYNATLSYYSGRPTFVWTANTPQRYRDAALTRAAYAIVTVSPSVKSGIVAALNQFRGVSERHPESMEWLRQSGFKEFARYADFVAFKKE
jgi:hypothetical protein